MEIKKKYSLNQLFVKFVVSLIGMLILGVIIPIVLSFICHSLGLTTSPTQGERAAQELVEITKEKQKFEVEDVSYLNKYLVLSSEKTVVATNMKKDIEARAIAFTKNGKQRHGNFMRVDLKNQTIVLYFKIKASYTSPILEQYFIAPEWLIIIAIFFNTALLTVIWTRRFSRKITKELIPINEVVTNIQNNDLNFDVQESSIIELNQILVSSEKMKGSLIENLEKNWSNERKHRDQMAALIHDIKTPLTGAIGWADLLEETDLNDEQQLYIKSLKKNQEAIEKLTNALMSVTLDKGYFSENSKCHDIEIFASDIIIEMEDMAKLKQIKIDYFKQVTQKNLRFDYQLLFQATINLFSNAIDFTPINGTIRFCVLSNQNEMSLVIEDSGPGFTEKEKEYGTTLFFMGDDSRSAVSHFGMGLAIAKKNSELLGGELKIGYSKDLGGALVEIYIPHMKKT